MKKYFLLLLISLFSFCDKNPVSHSNNKYHIKYNEWAYIETTKNGNDVYLIYLDYIFDNFYLNRDRADTNDNDTGTSTPIIAIIGCGIDKKLFANRVVSTGNKFQWNYKSQDTIKFKVLNITKRFILISKVN